MVSTAARNRALASIEPSLFTARPIPGFQLADDDLILSPAPHCVDRGPAPDEINQLREVHSGECATQRVSFLRTHPIDEVKQRGAPVAPVGGLIQRVDHQVGD